MTTKGITMVQMGWRVIHRIATAVLLLSFGTSAQALIYTGHFDPGSNGVTPGFSGDASFNIDPNCVTSNGWHATLGIGGCGASSVLTAIVTIFDSPLDPPPPGTPTDTLDFGSGAPVLGVLVEGGLVTAVDTDPLGPVPANVAPFVPHSYFLQFVTGQCAGDFCTTPPEIGCTEGCGFAAALAGDPIFLYQDVYDLQHQSAPAQFTSPLRLVPEPGTLSLILGAAGLGWWRRRNTRRN